METSVFKELDQEEENLVEGAYLSIVNDYSWSENLRLRLIRLANHLKHDGSVSLARNELSAVRNYINRYLQQNRLQTLPVSYLSIVAYRCANYYYEPNLDKYKSFPLLFEFIVDTIHPPLLNKKQKKKVTPNPINETKKEPKMKHEFPKVIQRTFIGETDHKEYSDQELFDQIRDMEKAVAEMEAIHTKPKKLQNKIDELKSQIKTLADFIDERDMK